MKVLFVARSFAKGGAATGAANLASALEAAGLEVIQRAADAPGPVKKAFRFAERVFERTFFDAETHCLRLGPASLNMPRLIERYQPDIVQLGDISANTIRYVDLPRIDRPVVHRMSDFWPYNGPAHYGLQPENAPRLARVLFEASMQEIPTPLEHTRVAPSHWLARNVQGKGPVEVIPNAVSAIDTPVRSLSDGPLRLGFIAGRLSDPRKGYARMITALEHVKHPVTLHTFGRTAPNLPETPVPVIHHGPYAPDEHRTVFDSFDVLLAPSHMDNSPNTVTEALAHGRPVVGQKGTGIDTYITSERGALIDFEDPAQLAPELDRITFRYDRLSAAASDYAQSNLSLRAVGQAYAALYRRLLQAAETAPAIF